MLQGRCRSALGEIVGLLLDKPPVRHPQECGQRVVPQPGQGLGGQKLTGRAHGQHHQNQRRQQPARTANPEPGQVDTPGAAQLVEQQRRDQESAQDKEDVDAQEPAAHTGDAAMLGEHQRNRYRAESVQSGNAAAPLRFIPNRQPAGTPHGGNPSALPSGTVRCGISPARLSAGC